MRWLLALAVPIYLSGVFSAGAQPAPPLAWIPSKTQVLIVGALKWQQAKAFKSLSAENRREAVLADFFRKAGVPEKKLIYLQDRAATLAGMRRSLDRLLESSSAGETLVLYYRGRGFSAEEDPRRVLLAGYDAGVGGVTGWPVEEVVAKIEAGFKGERVVFLVDCSQSGALAVELGRKERRLSYACFASAEADKSSSRRWTFTESLLAAWKGEGPADADRNGWVTVAEMKRYVDSEMAYAEKQKPVLLLTGTWKGTDLLARARKLRHVTEGEQVQVFWGNSWWDARVLNEKDGKYQIFYYGYEADDIEWVELKRLRKRRD